MSPRSTGGLWATLRVLMESEWQWFLPPTHWDNWVSKQPFLPCFTFPTSFFLKSLQLQSCFYTQMWHEMVSNLTSNSVISSSKFHKAGFHRVPPRIPWLPRLPADPGASSGLVLFPLSFQATLPPAGPAEWMRAVSLQAELWRPEEPVILGPSSLPSPSCWHLRFFVPPTEQATGWG